jgi:hypothetical protein
MIRIRDTRYPSTAALLSDAIKIAEYYGFVPIEELPRGDSFAKKPPAAAEIEEVLNFRKQRRARTSWDRA